jgi:uncharacterized protein
MSLMEEQSQLSPEPKPPENDSEALPELVPVNGVATVFVAADRLSAEILIISPSGGGQAVTEEEAMAKLLEAGVVHGIDAGAVAQAVADARCEKDQEKVRVRDVVARGKPAVVGEDGHIDYHPTLTELRGKPRILDDGTVDLLELDIVRNVTKDTVLADVIPATPGVPGVTVTGLEIAPRAGKDPRLVAGKGARFSEDRLKLIAAVDGCPLQTGDEVSVSDHYEVKGDVGVATGHIKFVGSVLVRGSVRRSFRVKAEGDVEVCERVDGGFIEATGDVIVHQGITPGSQVIAGGSIRARFIESAEVRARKDIWAADEVLQSKVEAGGVMEVLGRRGAIVGGRLVAKTSVSARVLGSSMGTPTVISVGMSPQARLEMVDNKKKLLAAQEEFRRTDQTIQRYMEQDRRRLITQHGKMLLSKLARRQEELFTLVQELETRAKRLEQESAEDCSAFVQAKDTCHPGVLVTIGRNQYRVTQAVSPVKIHLNEDREIVGS